MKNIHMFRKILIIIDIGLHSFGGWQVPPSILGKLQTWSVVFCGMGPVWRSLSSKPKKSPWFSLSQKARKKKKCPMSKAIRQKEFPLTQETVTLLFYIGHWLIGWGSSTLGRTIILQIQMFISFKNFLTDTPRIMFD